MSPEPSSADLQGAADLALAIAALDQARVQQALSEAPSALAHLCSIPGSADEGLFLSDLATRLSALNAASSRDLAFHFRIPQISQRFGPEGSLPLIASLLFCLHRERAEEGLDSERQPEDAPSPRLQALDALAAAGWRPTPSDAERLFRKACEEGDSAVLARLAEMGEWGPELLALSREPHTELTKAFWRESERDLAHLERLAQLGVLTDDPQSVGVSDFLARGQMLCAQRLVAAGLKPRPALFGEPRHSAVDALALGVSALELMPRSRSRSLIQDEGLLDWLAAQGAPFSSQDPSYSPSQGAAPDPLAILAGKFERPHLREALHRWATAFAQRGADPNATGLFLSRALISSGPSPAPPNPFELALSLGADPKAHPDYALVAPLYWDAAPAERLAGIERLLAMGVDPKGCSLQSHASWHPVAQALCGKLSNADCAWRLLDLGAPIAWRDLESSQSFLHLIVAHREPIALEAAERFLGLPGALSLLDSTDSWGRTPLMIACSQGRPDVASLLASLGASVNAQDRQGLSPMHHAARDKRRALEHAHALLPLRPDLSLTSEDGLTPAQLFIERRALEAAFALLELRPQDVAGDTPAAEAAREDLTAFGPQGLALLERCAMAHIAHAPANANEARRGLAL